MNEKLIAGISLIKSSNYRYKILKSIGNEIKTPSEIAKEVDIRLNHVSMFLKELKESNLVVCLNESAKKGRLYRLTELGKSVIKNIS